MVASNPGIMQRFEDYRPSKTMLSWACAFSVVATMVVGFTWAGWVSGGTAAEMAKKSAEGASASLAATICAVQFENDPAHLSQLASLNKAERWDRAGFITKGGWATLPGMKEPLPGAADLCAQQLTAAPFPSANNAETSR
jgi:hypothetical protein